MDGRDETRKIGKLKKDPKAPFDESDPVNGAPPILPARRAGTALTIRFK